MRDKTIKTYVYLITISAVALSLAFAFLKSGTI